MALSVLHIDSEKTWRGGQQQVAYLLKGLFDKGIDSVLVCQPESEYTSYCVRENIPFFPVKMRGELDFIAAWKIAGVCRKNNCNILHLHSAHALAIGLWVKLFLPSIKLVSVRRVDFPIKKNPLSQFKYKSRNVDKHICISDNIRAVMIQDGIQDNRLVTIHSGIDTARFSDITPPSNFRESLNIPESHFVVGTVAALAGHKDYPNLLHAAKIVLEKRDDVTFVAAGSGPDEKEIFSLKEKLNLGNRFIFAGYRTDVGNFLKTFDIFVLASFLEGLGTSLLDAQACGLPVIGCHAGGIPEIISHDHNGLLVQARDSHALAEAISLLLDDDRKRHRLGEAARVTVEKFSIQTTISKNIDLYLDLLKAGNGK